MTPIVMIEIVKAGQNIVSWSLQGMLFVYVFMELHALYEQPQKKLT